MRARVDCPSCGTAVTIPDHLQDKAVRCPKCREQLSAFADTSDEEKPARRKPRRKQAQKSSGSQWLVAVIVVGVALLLCAAAAVVAVVYLGKDSGGTAAASTSQPTVPLNGPPGDALPGWQPYSSTDARFAALFPPGQVVQRTSEYVVEDGRKGPLRMFRGADFGIAVFAGEFPAGYASSRTPEQLLDQVATGDTMRFSTHKQVNSRALQVAGVQAREITLQSTVDGRKTSVRIMIVENRFYQLLVYETVAKKFFDSFQLTK